MEIGCDASRVTGSSDPITVWDAKRLSAFRSNPCSPMLHQIIDAMGLGSKQAQGITSALTSVERLKANPEHKLYLFCQDRRCIGILKIGSKKLFIRRPNASLVEMEPLCVLDFYVHEAEQRSGFGKVLFEYMVMREGTEPRKLAIDRPSSKFLGFLRKHYHLSEYTPQSNNFVVFHQYFQDEGASCPPPPSAMSRSNQGTTDRIIGADNNASGRSRPHSDLSSNRAGLHPSRTALSMTGSDSARASGVGGSTSTGATTAIQGAACGRHPLAAFDAQRQPLTAAPPSCAAHAAHQQPTTNSFYSGSNTGAVRGAQAQQQQQYLGSRGCAVDPSVARDGFPALQAAVSRNASIGDGSFGKSVGQGYGAATMDRDTYEMDLQMASCAAAAQRARASSRELQSAAMAGSGIRRASPTRSAVEYNIISLQGGSAGTGHSSTAAGPCFTGSRRGSNIRY